jgi:hypothetical protein
MIECMFIVNRLLPPPLTDAGQIMGMTDHLALGLGIAGYFLFVADVSISAFL